MEREKVILHIDANNFFASVECALKPELKDKKVAVSGNPKKRTGIILAKNQLAKQLGVQTGEPIWQAVQKCPDLICVPPHMELYESYSKKLQKIYEKYTDLVEAFSIDECWLDITASEHLFGGRYEIAEKIRQEVKTTLGITVSIGISFCKLFAKLGSDLKKPDAITVIPKEKLAEIVYPLPIASIIGIGKRTEKALHKINVFKLGELIDIPGYILKKKFGTPMQELRKKLLGFDNEPVASSTKKYIPKSVGNGTTNIVDIFSREEIMDTLTFLSDKIAVRLRHQELLATSIYVGIVTCNFNYFHHSKSMLIATNSANDIRQEAMDLIENFWDFSEKIRAIRVSTTNLCGIGEVQLSIFQPIEDKKERFNATIDILRKQYGKKSITTANMLSCTHLNK